MGKVIIDEERCKGCGLCVDVCPKHILTVAESTNSFGYQPARPVRNKFLNGSRVASDDEECTGCTLCAQMCPDLAIEVYK